MYLDNINNLTKYDKSGMLETIESFAGQCEEALRIGSAFRLPDNLRQHYENILFTGMGGSAIGADILRSYVLDEVKIPVLVNRNYTLPGFVGKRTLVIASSYSGNTEETLSAYADARKKRASLIAITSGGLLRDRARTDGFPVIVVPGGLAPRAALGYSFFTALTLIEKLGVIGDKSNETAETISLLRRLKDDDLGGHVAGRKNVAKALAVKLKGSLAVIYGGQDHMDSVATRWRAQIEENSKALAASHTFPEMNHNEVVGWENPEKVLKAITVIILRDRDDHRRNSIRMDITGNMLKKASRGVYEIESRGRGLLARIFSLIYTGDFVSYYLAILNKVDPTPVERIARLKKELEKR